MTAPKNFWKIVIFKTGELVSFWGVKSHFGQAQKFLIFEKKLSLGVSVVRELDYQIAVVLIPNIVNESINSIQESLG